MTHPLHVREWGTDGPPVVLLHGLGASASFWRPRAESVRADLRVVAPDLLGFGRSPWPRDASYTPKEHLDSLEPAIERTIPGGAVVLGGHSVGAVLTLPWAARRPRSFSSVILIGLPVFQSAAAARSHMVSLSPLARIAIGHPRLGAALTAVMCRTRPFWRGVAPLLGGGFPADVARDWVLDDWRSYGGTLVRCFFSVRLPRMAGRVAGLGITVERLRPSGTATSPRMTKTESGNQPRRSRRASRRRRPGRRTASEQHKLTSRAGAGRLGEAYAAWIPPRMVEVANAGPWK